MTVNKTSPSCKVNLELPAGKDPLKDSKAYYLTLDGQKLNQKNAAACLGVKVPNSAKPADLAVVIEGLDRYASVTADLNIRQPVMSPEALLGAANKIHSSALTNKVRQAIEGRATQAEQVANSAIRSGDADTVDFAIKVLTNARRTLGTPQTGIDQLTILIHADLGTKQIEIRNKIDAHILHLPEASQVQVTVGGPVLSEEAGKCLGPSKIYKQKVKIDAGHDQIVSFEIERAPGNNEAFDSNNKPTISNVDMTPLGLSEVPWMNVSDDLKTAVSAKLLSYVK